MAYTLFGLAMYFVPMLLFVIISEYFRIIKGLTVVSWYFEYTNNIPFPALTLIILWPICIIVILFIFFIYLITAPSRFFAKKKLEKSK